MALTYGRDANGRVAAGHRGELRGGLPHRHGRARAVTIARAPRKGKPSCQPPGRPTLVDLPSGRVLVDHCHTVAGMEALADDIDRPAPARSVATITIPGDRRDEDIAAFARIAGRTFAGIILSEGERCGRAPGEVAALMHGALLDAGVDLARITIATDPMGGLPATLDRVRPDRPGWCWWTTPPIASAAPRACWRGQGRERRGVAAGTTGNAMLPRYAPPHGAR